MSYLQRDSGTGIYRVRIGVPEAARERLGKRELKRSLKTTDREEAKRLSLPVVAEFQKQIDQALGRGAIWDRIDMPSALIAFAGSWKNRIDTRLDQFIYQSEEAFLEDFGKWSEAKLPGATPDDLTGFRRYIMDRFRTNDSSDPLGSQLYPGSTGPMRPVGKINQIRLSDLEQRLIDHKGYRKRVIEDCRKSFAYLRELNTDVDLRQIGPDQIRELRDLLLKNPVTGRKKSMGLRESAQREWDHTMNPKTVAKLLGFIRSGFKLAVSEGWADLNPTTDITVPKRTATSRDKPRKEFNPDELTKLFTSPLFRGCQSEELITQSGNVQIRDYRYWIPYVALFSGARLSEMVGLEKSDIRQDQKIWFIRYTTRSDDPDMQGQKEKKNKFSTRDVPIHSGLLELGFVEWVSEQPEGRLFPSQWSDTETYARIYSKDFRGYLDRIGIHGPTMHGFRHGFATATRMAGLPDEIHNTLAGRSQKGVGQTYGKQKRKIEFLRDQIESLVFEGLPK
jgi:integrase